MRIKSLLLILLLFCSFGLLAQSTGGIKGMVVTRTTPRVFIDGAKVTLNTPQIRTMEAARGIFEFTDVPAGTWRLTIEGGDFVTVVVDVIVTGGVVRDIGMVSLMPDVSIAGLDPDEVTEFDMELGDGGQDLPVSLSATKDVFDNVASYKFSALRFRNRGYDNGTAALYLNGIYMNDAQSGNAPWSLWGGLNEATRNQEASNSMMVSDFGVGTIGGTVNINATASMMRKGIRTSVVTSSGQYRFRAMFTYASEESKKGWTYALSFSTRQGGNDWVNGASYNAWAYFGSIEKRINEKSRIALTALGAPVVRGVAAASTQEVYDLVGSNFYNANWGYQGGTYSLDGRKIDGKNSQMRNARERNNHEPIAMVNYSLDMSPKNKLLLNVSYRFGRNGYSALDWYDAQDPRPDYYRYLPSYFPDDPLKAGYVAEGWDSDWNIRQINWDKLYNINRNSFFSPSDNTSLANPDKVTRSKFVIEERRTDQQEVTLKGQFISLMTNDFKLNAGLEYRWNRTEYYKILKDLLGGNYWLDIDQFAERDFGEGDAIQNDLNNRNRIVKEGDRYGYNYLSNLRNEKAWTILRYNHNRIEAFAALEGGHVQFWREGLYRKGLFPNDSYGHSEKQDFWTYTAKGGFTYKISGSHVLWTNIGYMEEAPFFQGSMISPRTRNDFLPGLTTKKTASVDLNYSMRLPWMKMRLSGYYTTIKDQVNLISFYDDLNRTYTNFAMRGIDQMHTGMELGIEAPLVYDITLKGAFSYGYYAYTSNPLVTQTADNSNRVLLENETVYWKNYKIEGTPQTAGNVGLNYRARGNLFLGLDLSYFDANYISMSPLRRTDMALVNLDADQITAMTKQEMFPAAFILNANIGKSWYLGKYNLGFSLEVKNILNDTNIKTGGYEQMRLRKDDDNPDRIFYKPFDSKYYYLFGTNYYLNVYLRF